MNDIGSLAEWVGSVATVVSVVVATIVFWKTTKDGQTQSRLNWKPHLAFDQPVIRADGTGVWQVGATNIGKGPALECRYVAYTDGEYYRAAAFAIGSEERLQSLRCAVLLQAGVDDNALRLGRSAVRDLCAQNARRTWEVILCSDIFGERWRFVRGRPYPDGPRPATEAGADEWWTKWHAGPQSGEGQWVQRARDEELRRAAR